MQSSQQIKVPVADPKRFDEREAFVDFLVKCLNIWMMISRSRKASNSKFANTFIDAPELANELHPGQFFRIYNRITSKYRYHALQRFENAVRRFDVKDYLASAMLGQGNLAFYSAVFPNNSQAKQTNFAVDLTTLNSVSTVTSSANYLQQQLAIRAQTTYANCKESAPHPDKPRIARQCYVRGYSRIISALDYDDWERFRKELRGGKHLGAGLEDNSYGEDILIVALSYKAKEIKITRRMRLLNEDGSEVDDEGLLKETQQLTRDFLDDFRWSQTVRSCMALAKARNKSGVRVWIDRLVMMDKSLEERKNIYRVVDWPDFGLLSYAVCPVIRIYGADEERFKSDFWRKLEAVMGVAGHGLVVDDYQCRQFDETVYYGPSLYSRLSNGLATIGGGGIYVRTGTLAVATAVLTDGVSVAAANEDIRTKKAVVGWKSWALRTISQGAYSASHSFLMYEEKPFEIRLDDFEIISVWESIVSRCEHLQGKSYLDVSFQRSEEWKTSAEWDGVVEWLGMKKESCLIIERDAIIRFLKEKAEVELYCATSGHVAGLIRLHSIDNMEKRVLAVNLSRFSTGRRGHVTGVAEATGLWDGKSMHTPWLMEFQMDPDEDQKVAINSDKIVEFTYKQPKVVYVWEKYFILPIVLFITIFIVMVWMTITFGFNVIVIMLDFFLFIPSMFLIAFLFFKSSWPWVDESGVGEGLFDNVLMHGLHDAGIKTQYRQLKSVPYDELGWS